MNKILEKIKKLLRRVKCTHEFNRYEVLSDNFTVIGYKYTLCNHCGKKWNKLNTNQQDECKYVDAGIAWVNGL